MLYRQMISQGQQFLESKGIQEAAVDAWLLFSYLKKVDRTWYLMHMMEEVPQETYEAYQLLLTERGSRKPLQYITGTQMFMGLEFLVNESVLIPRQDTEILVETCLRVMKDEAQILDMCTGSGCILISLIKYGKHIKGVGADLSGNALDTARKNAALHNIDASFVQSDLFSEIEGEFDLIVSNPPYITEEEMKELMPEVFDHEPHMALEGGFDGLDFYRRIVAEGTPFLKDGGWLCFEIGCSQGLEVSKLLQDNGYDNIEIIKDLAGLDRVVAGRYRREKHV